MVNERLGERCYTTSCMKLFTFLFTRCNRSLSVVGGGVDGCAGSGFRGAAAVVVVGVGRR